MSNYHYFEGSHAGLTEYSSRINSGPEMVMNLVCQPNNIHWINVPSCGVLWLRSAGNRPPAIQKRRDRFGGKSSEGECFAPRLSPETPQGAPQPLEPHSEDVLRSLETALSPTTAGKGSTGPAHLPMVVFRLSSHSGGLLWSSVASKG